MPTVAIDVRGGGPGAAELLAELRRFEGLRTPAWRAWSRLGRPGRRPCARRPAAGAAPVPGRRDAHARDPRGRPPRRRARALPLAVGDGLGGRAPGGASRPAPGGAAGAGAGRCAPVVRPPACACRRTGDYVLALADDPDALERAWEAGGDPAVPLVVADAGEPAAAVVRGARALADLRGAVLFGATALTALEGGVPVVAGAGGAAAEAIGEDGAVVDLEDPEGAVAALRHALADRGDPGPRRARAGLFTWQGTAEATVMAYRELW